MILETIVTTRASDGDTHIAPMGVREQAGLFVLSPFRPSRSLDNIVREGSAVINYTDDASIFVGCLTGHRDWPLYPAVKINGHRLEHCLGHVELELEHIKDDEQRPELLLRPVYEETHAPFHGFNRAQAALIEASILVSRLHILPWEKIKSEIDYLAIAVVKTAGPREQLAWGWLMQRIALFRAEQQEECDT
ncbi:MAG TPA: DUF447 family protein [Gammaproteobacteria bacterium]|nr:DUF447 family protein [Gammaproteobacteria bacterium]